MTKKKLLALLTAGLALGCGGGSSGPSEINISGTYQGVAQDSFGGAGTFRATLSQSGPSVSGTWTIAFPNAGITNSGSLTSATYTASSQTLRANLTPTDPRTCPFSLQAVADGRRIEGNYQSFNCTGTIVGTVNALKQ